MNKKAFTLVELVVIVTILIVLATIWIINYLGYSSQARDSLRLTDLWNIKKSIDMYEANNSKLPDISEPFSVLSWTQILFNQWVFWTGTVATLKWFINEVPKDPITWIPYSYSLANNKVEYELGWLLENEKMSYFPIEQANADAEQIFAQSIIKWNYNWKFVKTISNDGIIVLASPSITINTDDINQIQDIASQNLFVYDRFYNLPQNFQDSKYSVNWSISNRFLNQDFIELYNWSIIDLNKDSNQLAFLTNLQNAYIWTHISWDFAISKLLEQDINNPESLKYIKLLLNTLVSDKISMK